MRTQSPHRHHRHLVVQKIAVTVLVACSTLLAMTVVLAQLLPHDRLVLTAKNQSIARRKETPAPTTTRNAQEQNREPASSAKKRPSSSTDKGTNHTAKKPSSSSTTSSISSLLAGQSSRGGGVTRGGGVGTNNSTVDYLLSKFLSDEEDDETQKDAALELKTMELHSMHHSAMEVKKLEVDETRRHNEHLEAIQREKLVQENRMRSLDIARAEISL